MGQLLLIDNLQEFANIYIFFYFMFSSPTLDTEKKTIPHP